MPSSRLPRPSSLLAPLAAVSSLAACDRLVTGPGRLSLDFRFEHAPAAAAALPVAAEAGVRRIHVRGAFASTRGSRLRARLYHTAIGSHILEIMEAPETRGQRTPVALRYEAALDAAGFGTANELRVVHWRAGAAAADTVLRATVVVGAPPN